MAANTEMAKADVFGKTTLPDKLEVVYIYLMDCFMPGIALFGCLQLCVC